MTIAQKLERLARLVPGVAGYQDAEKARATDKTVRLRLTAAIEELEREVETEQRRLSEAHALDRLAGLGRLSAKLGKLANQVRYASRGYRGFFDTYKLTQAKLDKLYDFDLGIFSEVDSLRSEVSRLRAAQSGEAAYASAIDAIDQALDRFEVAFARRAEMLIAE
jgi:hypothetical protein